MEESFLKMDIFFVVATTMTAIFGALVSILVYQLIKLVKDIREITATVKKEAQEVVDDIHEVRQDVKDGIATAKRYTQAVAGAGIVRGLASLMEAFGQERAQSGTRKKRTSRSKREEE